MVTVSIMSFFVTTKTGKEIANPTSKKAVIKIILFFNASSSQILDLTVVEALEVFDAIPQLKLKLQILAEVGLGYLKLGQAGATLSGGEAQRLKLAAELARPADKHTLYVLDEPTIGLHFADVRRLVECFIKLRDKGHTIIVIEHNEDVITAADCCIEL
jgi:excinuclease ABC subunit A